MGGISSRWGNVAVGLEAGRPTLFMLTSELGALGGFLQAQCRSRHGINKLLFLA